MSFIVILSPIHFFHFFLLWIIIYKSKTTIFSFKGEIKITSLFRKLTKVSTNNFKIDFNRISDPLEIWKKYCLCIKIFDYQPIRNFIPYCRKTGSRSIIQVLPSVVLHVRFVQHISMSGVSIGLHRFFQKPSKLNKIVLKQVEENAKTK